MMFHSLFLAFGAIALFFVTVLAAPSTIGSVGATSVGHSLHRRINFNHHKLAASIPVGLTPDQEAYLSGHNQIRKSLGAANLSWSNNLAAAAQDWANGCKFEHSGGSLGAYGENIAAGTGDFTIPAVINVWAEEASQYDPSIPSASDFTQIVWKSTTKVGCAVAECIDIFSAEMGVAHYYVCEYFPAGNVVGQFKENV